MNVLYKSRLIQFTEGSEKWSYDNTWFKTLKAAKEHIDKADLDSRRIPNVPVYYGYYGEKNFGHAVLREGNHIWIRTASGNRTKVKIDDIAIAGGENERIYDRIAHLVGERNRITEQIAALRAKYVHSTEADWIRYESRTESGFEEGGISHVPV